MNILDAISKKPIRVPEYRLAPPGEEYLNDIAYSVLSQLKLPGQSVVIKCRQIVDEYDRREEVLKYIYEILKTLTEKDGLCELKIPIELSKFDIARALNEFALVRHLENKYEFPSPYIIAPDRVTWFDDQGRGIPDRKIVMKPLVLETISKGGIKRLATQEKTMEKLGMIPAEDYDVLLMLAAYACFISDRFFSLQKSAFKGFEELSKGLIVRAVDYNSRYRGFYIKRDATGCFDIESLTTNQTRDRVVAMAGVPAVLCGH